MRYLYFSFLCLALLGLPKSAKAQRYFVTNQYAYDLFLVNPAAAAVKKDCYVINAYYQKQWLGTELAPTTQMLVFQRALKSDLGIGTYVYNDRNGYHHEFGGQLSAAYRVTLKKTRRKSTYLLFGLSLMANQRSIDVSSFGSAGALDPAIGGGSVSGFGYNANSGVMLKVNRWHVGFAATNMFPFVNSVYSTTYEPKTHLDYNLHGGTIFKVPSYDLFLEPLIYYRTNGYLDSRVDLNLLATMPTPDPNLTLWGLLAYRRTQEESYGKSLGFATTFGVYWNKFKIGLEYQLGLTDARSAFGNSYQLILGYRFCPDRSKNALLCPEDFKRNKNRIKK